MRKWFVRALAGALGAAILTAPLAWAAPAAPNTGSPGQGLEISPPVLELSADPGQTVNAVIRVRNVTNGELIAKGKTDDFGAGSDEGGQPKLLLDETGATRYSLKYWVSGVPDLRLASHELKATTITIKVPANAEPGGHFGVVRFSALPPELSGTGVALSASVGTLVLLRVNGQITEKVSLAEFKSGKPGPKVDSPYDRMAFFENGPVGFIVRVKNDGSVHEKVKGSITVFNMLGRKVGTVAVNPHGGNVLPDSVRKFEQGMGSHRLFGYYTAKLSLSYAGSKKLEGQLAFWVIPWRLILLVMAGLVVLFFLGRIGLRKYNERIIAKARGR